MKILVVGSGGREHAICHAFQQSERVEKIYCAPGNAGIAEIAECINIKPDRIGELADLAEKLSVDLTFVGGETSLALGIVDEFAARGLKIVGPTAAAARLESSKSFAKAFMNRRGVLTARHFTASSAAEAVEILDRGEFGDENAPVVVKADGLAAGKGVVVAADRREARQAIDGLGSLAGAAADSIVLEECLVGREVSLLLFSDGENYRLMPSSRDHKRIGEGDRGPNTGGMGTITDADLLSAEMLATIEANIIEPTLRGCREEGFPFKGVLFLGLMIGRPANGSGPESPYLLEYNVRFGDPETQSILVRLESDLVSICEAMIAGTLGSLDVNWKTGNSATVVLAAEGYPESPRTGDEISGIENAAATENVTIFHAGTSLSSGRTVTAGGRVLGVTAVGSDLSQALDSAYSAVAKISWNGMQYRRDIGK